MIRLAGSASAALAFALVAGAAPGAGIEGANLATGQELYLRYCANCHGVTGDGNGRVGREIQPRPRDFTKGDFKFGNSDQDLFEVITNGAAARGGSPYMWSWAGVIPDPAHRWALVAYIRSLKR